MPIHDIAEWIRHIALFTAVRESRLMYPIILSTHLSCIAVFGGLILVTDLRLLGLVLTRYSIASVVSQLRPWKWAGFILMVSMGILLAGSKANIYYDNPYFVMKISTLLLIAVHFLIFRKSVYRDETEPSENQSGKNQPGKNQPRSSGIAKLAGATSLALWITVVTMGRWIAYYDRPDAAEFTAPTGQTTAVSAVSTRLANVRPD